MIRRAASLVILLAAAMAGLSRFASGQAFMTESGYIEFNSKVPLHSFTGRSDQLVGMINLADSTVDFYIDLETLRTGIGKRDKDMRKTLNVEEFPFAEFFGKLTTGFAQVLVGPQQITVGGLFKLHGIGLPIRIEGTLENTADGLRVRAEFSLNIEDYDIVPPKILFMRVDEIQRIRINALLTPISH